MADVNVRWLTPLTKSGGDEVLRLDVDGREVGMTLRIGLLNRQLMEGLQARALDLLEIAALVYCADAAVSRGGPADQKMGEKWHRRFLVEMAVRDARFWQDGNLKVALEETLMFLSGDRFQFTFVAKNDAEAERTRFFKFGRDGSWQADRVLMFSGGLDSFAGAVEEIIEHKHRVALVSHSSATKIAPVQSRLYKALRDKLGPDTCRHVPVTAQLKRGALKEGTHRTRSFLFAVLGAITAQAFKLDRVSFHENGIVSLNLPPVANVIGTRATRTTHPQTLSLFSQLLGKVFEDNTRVDNPFFWRTKADVVDRIVQLGMGEQIVETRSCADVHNQTKQYPHCGRCSQCIDRRFAILSKGLEHLDPEEAYRVDLIGDARTNTADREMALSYVRNAQFFEHAVPEQLTQHFPIILDAVNYLENPPATALSTLTRLLNRHGNAVMSVMRRASESRTPLDFPEQSLPRLFGTSQSSVGLPTVPVASVDDVPVQQLPLTIEIDKKSKLVVISDRVELKNSASANLLLVLAERWLLSAGDGLDPLDYPFLQAGMLAELLNAESEAAVRRQVMIARRHLSKKLQSAGVVVDDPESLIENHPWHGYRLAPDRVIIRVRAQK